MTMCLKVHFIVLINLWNKYSLHDNVKKGSSIKDIVN
jgi:hypothetical protein